MKISKIKLFFKENMFFIITFFIGIMIIYIPIPYYIEAPGSLINVENRIKIQNPYPSQGSFEMAYVSSMKASLPTLFMSLFHQDWDIKKKQEMVAEGESEKEAEYRSHLSLQEGNQKAIIYAYKSANKNIEIKNQNIFVSYLFPEGKTNLQVGDKINTVMNQKITSLKDLSDIIQKHSIGTKLNITVTHNKKIKNRYAYIIDYKGKKIIGIMTSTIYDLKTNPGIKIQMDNNESGASGGLMMTLSIYNTLIKEDITKGDKIAGTGTIEKDGSIGSIAGVKYKLIGAHKNRAKVFLVPAGDNYKTAKKIKKQKHMEIELVPVKTFEDALRYLKNRD